MRMRERRLLETAIHITWLTERNVIGLPITPEASPSPLNTVTRESNTTLLLFVCIHDVAGNICYPHSIEMTLMTEVIRNHEELLLKLQQK